MGDRWGAVRRHDPACFTDASSGQSRATHRDGPCASATPNQVLVDGVWIADPWGGCNVSDYDGFCYVHRTTQCALDRWAWLQTVEVTSC